MQRFIQAMVLK